MTDNRHFDSEDLTLHAMHLLGSEEAAAILELSAEAQRALLYRARGNLRNELEKRYHQ